MKERIQEHKAEIITGAIMIVSIVGTIMVYDKMGKIIDGKGLF